MACSGARCSLPRLLCTVLHPWCTCSLVLWLIVAFRWAAWTGAPQPISTTSFYSQTNTVLRFQCPCSPVLVSTLPPQVFTQVGGEEWSSLAAFHDCVGDINADQRNDMMEHEMESQRGGGDVGEVRSPSPVAASGCTCALACTYRRHAVARLHIALRF